jgi:hypothetical protein
MNRSMSIWLRMSVFGSVALAGAPLAFTAPPAVLDQSFVSGAGSPLGNDINAGFKFAAQTFTAGISGELEGVEIAVETFEAATSRLNVAIRTAANQIPTETVLGSILVDRDDTGIGNLIRFPETIEIVEGEEYAIVVDYPDVLVGESQGIWSGEAGDQYVDGAPSNSNDGSTWELVDGDLFFQTFVTIIQDHFVCYRIRRTESDIEGQEVIVNNQFGEQRLTIGKPETLCVPSSKELDE